MTGNPDGDRRPLLSAVCIFLLSISIAAVSLRFLSRKLSKGGFWWDDWLSLLSLLPTLALNSMVLSGVHRGFGLHSSDASPDVLPYFFKILYAGEILYTTGIFLSKISVLLFYSRIFSMVKGFRIALWVVTAVTTAWFLSLVLPSVFQCSPYQKAWDPSLPGHCINFQAFFLGQAITNIATDVALLLLPMPLLWKLHVPTPQKWGLIFVFVLGYFVPVVSILRLVSFFHLGSNSYNDVTWTFVDPYLWSCVEPSIAVVSTCIPSISYLFKRAISLFYPIISTGGVTCVNEERRGLRLIGQPIISGKSHISRHPHSFIKAKGDNITPIATRSEAADQSVRHDSDVSTSRETARYLPTYTEGWSLDDLENGPPLARVQVRNGLSTKYEPREELFSRTRFD